MSDAAFKTAPFAGYTTGNLLDRAHALELAGDLGNVVPTMRAEIERRIKVEAGDVSVMTPGERLRFTTTGKAR